MPTPTTIKDGEGTGYSAKVVNGIGEENALVVATRPLKEFDSTTSYFTNATYGHEMNQNAAFSGTSWVIADGGDTTAADSGTADTNTLNHIIQAAQNFTSTVAVGMTAWNTDDNTYGNVTVVNSDTDLTCDADVCPDGDEAYTIGPDWTFSEPVGTKWKDADGGQAHTGSASVKCDNPAVGDIVQFANVNGEDVDMSNFAAITMWIYVDKDWKGGDSFSIYGMVDGAQEGDKVFLEDYFVFDDYDEWQFINIPLSDMGLNATSIDALRIENEARQGGKSPKFWVDDWKLESSGTPLVFELKPDKGTWLYIDALKIFFVDAAAGDAADAINLSYDKIINATFTEGYLFERYTEAKTVPEASQRITELADYMSFPFMVLDRGSDGTNTWLSINLDQDYPLILKAETNDLLRITLEDDFSQLVKFRISATSRVEARE